METIMPVCTNCRKITRYKLRNGILCNEYSTVASESNNDTENDLSHNDNRISSIFEKMGLNYDIQQKIEDIYSLGSKTHVTGKPYDTENDYRQISK